MSNIASAQGKDHLGKVSRAAQCEETSSAAMGAPVERSCFSLNTAVMTNKAVHKFKKLPLKRQAQHAGAGARPEVRKAAPAARQQALLLMNSSNWVWVLSTHYLLGFSALLSGPKPLEARLEFQHTWWSPPPAGGGCSLH